jgi:Glucanosyltransferase
VWTSNLLDSYIATINAFSHYDNILAYNVGNEVVTAPNETNAAPFIKAAARDIKAYLSVHFVPILTRSLMLAFILETPRSRLHLLAMPQLMGITRGLFRLQTISRVILATLPSISMVLTISEYPVFRSVKTN